MAGEVLVPRSDGDEDESIASFVRRRFGAGGGGLPGRAAAGRHPRRRRRAPVGARAVSATASTPSASPAACSARSGRCTSKPSPQGAFVSLPGGTGELVDALVDALTPGHVVTRRARHRICDAAASGTSRLGRGRASQARAVILAVPAYVAGGAAAAVRHGAGGAVRGHSVRVDGDRRVRLSTRSGRASDARHRLRRAARRSAARCWPATWVTSKWPGRAPDGHVLLRAFLGGGRDPHASTRRRRS